MLITTLGTSHGDHTYCRFNSSTLFEIGENAYLIDAGAPVNALMIHAQKNFGKLKAVFITHMHDDHVGGLPGLIKALIKYPVENQHTKIYLPEKDAVPALQGWLKAQHLHIPPELVTLDFVKQGLFKSIDKLAELLFSCFKNKGNNSFSSLYVKYICADIIKTL